MIAQALAIVKFLGLCVLILTLGTWLLLLILLLFVIIGTFVNRK